MCDVTASDEGSGTGHAWFLGAAFRSLGVDSDQSEWFVREGIWENGCEDEYLRWREADPGSRPSRPLSGGSEQ